jgi:very-short-patch-repair endonuclease
MKNAEPILNQVKILGKSPSDVEDIERLKGIVKFDHLIATYLIDMNLSSSVVPTSRYDQVIWLNEQKKLLQKSIDFAEKVDEVKSYMKRKLPRTSPLLHDKVELDEIYDGALAINAVADLKNYQNDLNIHIAQVKNAVAGLNLNYVEDYVKSLEENDLSGFIKARSVLESHIDRLGLSTSLIAKISELVGSDFKFIESVTKWVDDEIDASQERRILEQVQKLVDAFKWKRLGEALGGVSSDEYGVLFRNVTRCDDSIEKHVRELARRRSWKKALDRIDAKTLSQMQRYALESRKYGAGTGITAARRMKEIRKLLNDCVPAIPAWIMPIDQVAQRFTAELEMFDVIIVDEASQARLDSIFLLALSKRVVIVGDHKQVSPEGGMLADSEVQQIVNRHLSDDSRKANWGNTDLSLFDECKAAFGNLVTLTEHRRCVPEIIGFSNQIAYIPENIRLIPVRQTGSEALPPIKTIFVSNGYVRKTSGQPENPPEADVIANEVARMIKDPAYRGQTIGVITLQGNKQQDLIRERLIKLVDPSEWDSRQIRVGMPPDFQGSERNVILLSMVMAPNEKFAAQTKENMTQRYNVAASRAKDQLILVHSLRSSDLKNTNDLRRQLLDYCLNVEAGLRNPVEGAVGMVPENEKVDPFDSLFEQRVHNRIVERGYKVIPQFKPEIDGGPDYRIDLVVVGPFGKFAIECDGDFWHGGPEAFANDLIRQEILQRCGWKFFRIPESRFYSDPGYLDELWPQLEKFVSVKATAVDPKPITPVQEVNSEEEIQESDSDEDSFSGNPEESSFNPDNFEFTSAGDLTPKEIYIDGLRVREFPKPISPEFSWLQPYRSWDREDIGSLTKISLPTNKILDELLEIVKIEGPMLGSYLMRRHYKATGGSSLSSNSEAAYIKQIKRVINRGEFVSEEQVSGESLASATFRTPDQPPVITRVRGARDLYEMPPREIAMIIRGVMKTKKELSKSSDRELLYRQVLLLLDFTKLTPKANDHLNRIFATYAAEITAP